MSKILANNLKIGDVIMPPPREVRLWMRRACVERQLPESALYLTVTDIADAGRDARGSWLLITAAQTSEWIGDSKPFPFRFNVRPATPWAIIKREGA